MGDFNVKMGREDSKQEETNNNVVKLIAGRNVRFMSTYYEQKDIYKSKWKSPYARIIN